VACEDFIQWVIEDKFCNGRPPLEKVGVQFTDKVEPFEKMKIRLLNGSHSAMAYLGYLCGYNFAYQIAQDKDFIQYLDKLMNIEVIPLVQDIEKFGINLNDYKKTLLKRFANSNIKDQTLRLCMDGSGKIPKYILPSIHEQLNTGGSIRGLTLCVASWIRFLAGVDENGNTIKISDPQADRLNKAAIVAKENLSHMLCLKDIFGELEHCEIFVKELKLLLNMLYEKGARQTLQFCIDNI